MKNTIIGVIIFTILFLGLGWLMVGRSPTETPVNLETTQEDHITGSATASATLIEYSDFQCPACAGYQVYVSQLKDELGDQLKIIFRHFPLDNIHPNARLAAQASEAASNQGEFWQMHDLLFENQQLWDELEDPTEEFTQYAKSLNLDIEKFSLDLNSKEVIDKVNSDYQTGLKAKVNSTPSFFINNQKITNPASYEVFKEIIQEKL
jgi:protein-disulfide isomerase